MEGLGINLKFFLFQLGNFVVLLAFLNYLLHKPLTNLLDKRRSDIKEGLEAAEKMKAEASKSEERQRKILADSQAQAAALITQVRQQSLDLEQRLRSEAEIKAKALLEKASQDIKLEGDQMRQELRGELAHMVLTATEKVLSSPLTAPEKEKQIATIVNELHS